MIKKLSLTRGLGLDIMEGITLALFEPETKGQGDFLYRKVYSFDQSITQNIGSLKAYSVWRLPIRLLSIPPQIQLSEYRRNFMRRDDRSKEFTVGQIVCNIDGSPAIPADFGDLSSERKYFFLSKTGVTVAAASIADQHRHNEIIRIMKHTLFVDKVDKRVYSIKSSVLFEGPRNDMKSKNIICYEEATNAAVSRLNCIKCSHLSHFIPIA
ncbi:MAG: hypothetical protein PHU42_03275 [Patescibacteria group bacterium]|nr:hypothetical protein [Patescibacteria group bacterium]